MGLSPGRPPPALPDAVAGFSLPCLLSTAAASVPSSLAFAASNTLRLRWNTLTQMRACFSSARGAKERSHVRHGTSGPS